MGAAPLQPTFYCESLSPRRVDPIRPLRHDPLRPSIPFLKPPGPAGARGTVVVGQEVSWSGC